MKQVLFLLLISLFVSCGDDFIFLDDSDWSFIVLGDVRSAYDTYEKHISLIESIHPKPEFILILGDLISKPGSEYEWNLFINKSKPLMDNYGFYTIIGNHDVNSNESQDLYVKMLGMPGNGRYYQFVENGIQMIVLDTEEPEYLNQITGSQLKWLKEQLDNSEYDPFVSSVILNTHRPLFSEAGRNIENAQEIHNLLLKHSKVKAVFSGHNHHFAKVLHDGIHYITTGGGGAHLHSEMYNDYYHILHIGITGEKIKTKTVGIKGEVVEEFEL